LKDYFSIQKKENNKEEDFVDAQVDEWCPWLAW
jgi:hypothetical protein